MQTTELQSDVQGLEKADFNNHGAVHNQAGSQTFSGSQYFGNVNIYSGAQAPQLPESNARLLNNVLASLAFPGMLDRRANITKPYRRTCEWIFTHDKYQNWREARSGLLWIKGKPGSGKSTIMSVIYTALEKARDTASVNGINLEFFFSARGAELQYTPLGMFRSLLNQLLRQDVSTASAVIAAYQEKCSAYGTDSASWSWQQPELEQHLGDAIIASSRKRQLTIFVDALDETGDAGAKYIAQFFHELNDRAAATDSISLKLCISSRHYPIASTICGSDIVVENHNRADIKTFLVGKLDVAKLDPDRHLEPGEWHQLKSDILSQAHGMFQWVVSVLPMLVRKLEEGWPIKDVRELLINLPRDLEDIYSTILRIHLKREYLSQSLLLFRWVCFSERPLSPTEMMCALASGGHPDSYSHSLNQSHGADLMRKRIESLSAGLVKVSYHAHDSTSTVQIIHQTVREFLMKQGLALLVDLRVDRDLASSTSHRRKQQDHSGECQSAEHQSALYESTSTYLKSLDLSNLSPQTSLDQDKPKPEPDSTTTQKSLQMNHPFAEYATKYVFVHAQKASNSLFGEGHESTVIKRELEILRRFWPQWSVCDRILAPINEDTLESKNRNLRSHSSICHTAASLNMDKVIQHLCDSGHSVDVEDEQRRTPLYVASTLGHREVSEALLQAGAAVQPRALAVSYPLIGAAMYGNLALVELLLASGARVNSCPSTGEMTDVSALIHAGNGGHLAVAQLLIDSGADVSLKVPEQGTTLMWAAQTGRPELVRMILKAGADVNAQGGFYGTVLCDAIYRGTPEVVKLLLDAGADPNSRDKYNNAPLLDAINRGKIEIVRILLDARADVNAPRNMYGTALYIAASQGDTEIVKMLIDAGADVNAIGGQYGTSLHAAAQAGQDQAIKMLIDAGADVNIHLPGHQSVLDCAKKSPSSFTKTMLVAAGAVDESLSISPERRTTV